MDKGKKINISTIIIMTLVAAVIGLFIWGSGNRNKTGAPAADAPVVDAHGHPLAAKVSSAAPLQNLVGKSAPDFVLSDRGGKQYSLSELRGKNVILFFNEGLMCYPACWNQIAAFSKDERFNNADIVVLSVVVDKPNDWQSAIDKMPDLAKATVVFDTNKTVSSQFGMLTMESSMHYGSLPGHTFVLIGKDGVIKHIFDDPNMGIHNDQLVSEINKLN